MGSDVVNVYLTGGKPLFGKGREEPLHALSLHCSKAQECSYFKEGSCRSLGALLRSGCKHGHFTSEKGYTSRAKKYRAFKEKWEAHEKYRALHSASDKLGVIGGEVVFPYPYCLVERGGNGMMRIKDPTFHNATGYIPLEEFTPEFIHSVCTFRPQAIMGGTIQSFQDEVVPRFLAHLEEVLPEKYAEFVAAYPEFNKEIDHVGRKAYLTTLNPSFIHYKSRSYPDLNSTWYWDGEYLTYEEGYLNGVTAFSGGSGSYTVENYTLKPDDKLTVKVEQNSQVNKNTVFVD
jgi:hypothetical protein